MRRAQSAVETMLLMPVLAIAFVAMYYLWSIAWAAQNAHIRSREVVLHGNAYLKDKGTSGSAPFSGKNYTRADSTTFNFSASSSDTSIAGPADKGEDISVTAVIASD